MTCEVCLGCCTDDCEATEEAAGGVDRHAQRSPGGRFCPSLTVPPAWEPSRSLSCEPGAIQFLA